MKLLSRSEMVARTRKQLLKHGFPRLQMLLIVCLTGAVGFVASFVLLQAGLTTLWLRYAIAMSVAYLGFMMLLWLWLHSKTSDYTEFPDLPMPNINSELAGNIVRGQGGQFGGAGANGSFEPIGLDGAPIESSAAIGDIGIGDIAEADELAIPIFAILIITALLSISAYIVYSAPMLLSELLVDGVLSLTLYKHLRKADSDHWLETAFRHTSGPFFIALFLLVALGWGLHEYTPTAHTLGEAISQHQPSNIRP